MVEPFSHMLATKIIKPCGKLIVSTSIVNFQHRFIVSLFSRGLKMRKPLCLRSLQGYLASKKRHSPRTLQ